MKQYTNEEIIRGLVGDKSVSEIINTMLLSIAKLNLRVQCVEESIDDFVEVLEKLEDEDDA